MSFGTEHLHQKIHNLEVELKQVKAHNKTVTKLLLERNKQVEAAKSIMQEWFDSEKWDESYDHEILCRLDVVLNNRKQSSEDVLNIPRTQEQMPKLTKSEDKWKLPYK